MGGLVLRRWTGLQVQGLLTKVLLKSPVLDSFYKTELYEIQACLGQLGSLDFIVQAFLDIRGFDLRNF